MADPPDPGWSPTCLIYGADGVLPPHGAPGWTLESIQEQTEAQITASLALEEMSLF